jgi:hypothetical protein
MVEGTVMLSIAGVDTGSGLEKAEEYASTVLTADTRLILAVIAATVTQASASRIIFIRKPSEVVRVFDESCLITIPPSTSLRKFRDSNADTGPIT